MHLSGYFNATLINNNKLKISIELFPDVIKSALQKSYKIKYNIEWKKSKKIKFKVIR